MLHGAGIRPFFLYVGSYSICGASEIDMLVGHTWNQFYINLQFESILDNAHACTRVQFFEVTNLNHTVTGFHGIQPRLI